MKTNILSTLKTRHLNHRPEGEEQTEGEKTKEQTGTEGDGAKEESGE